MRNEEWVNDEWMKGWINDEWRMNEWLKNERKFMCLSCLDFAINQILSLILK